MSDTASRTAAKPQAASRARQPAQPRGSAAQPRSALAALQADAGNRAVSALLGGGAPLSPAVRDEMEARFGESFAAVRVHDGPQAARSATALAAHAYTRGEHIVFNARRYAPEGGDGRRLLAHELAHVVQQRRGGAAPALDPQAPHEQAADRAADAVAAGATSVAVEGGTGVGVACDNWFTRKYKALKEEIPEDYREIAADLVKGTADAVVSTTMSPFLPPPVTEGWGSAAVTAADLLAEGDIEQIQEDVKGAARDRLLDVVGGTSGIVKQATEIVDTAIWVGQENRAARESAIEAAGGKESLGGTFVQGLYESASNLLLPGAGLALDAYAAGGDFLAEAGGQDDFGRPSLTRLYSGAADSLIKSIEETVGGTPDDPGLFTRAEKAELTTMIGSQVALAFIGAEEVKLVLNAAGALGSLRGVVETMRHNKDWASDPTFWGHIIGGVLSVVGLGSSIAKPKIIQMVLKYGWVAAAVPPMVAMLQDYTAYLNGEISEEECDQRMKKHFAAACNVLKDAILHISQSGGGKGGAPEEGPPAAPKSATVSEGEGGAPASSRSGAPPEGEASVTPPTKATTPAPVSGEANVVPIGEGAALPQSAASKKLDAALAKQPVEQAGTVTPLRPRKSRTLPHDTEPVTQALPREEKLAVGQTHGAEGGAAKRPPLSVVADPDAPRASATTGGGGRAGGPALGAAKPEVHGGGTASGTGRPTGGRRPPSRKPSGPAPTKKRSEVPDGKPPAVDAIEARLKALEGTEVPPELARPKAAGIALVRKSAKSNPARARKLLQALEAELESANVVLPGQTLEPETRRMLGGGREASDLSEDAPRIHSEERKNLPERADERFPWQVSEEDAALVQGEFPQLPGKGWRAQRPIRSRPAGSERGSGKSGKYGGKKPTKDREEVFAEEDGTEFVVVDKGRTQRGDTKPELFHPGGPGQAPISVEVKNWPLGDEAVAGDPFLMTDFIQKTGHQAQLRAANLPSNTEQYLIIDLRGQTVSKATQEGIKRDLEVSSNGAYQADRIRFLTWGSSE